MRDPIIYIVDDQRAVCSALREMLSVLGHEAEAFGSARDFLVALDATRPACLVADVRMPDMDGIELVRELVRRRLAVPTVLMSGYADVQMAVEAIKAGAEDLIEKPGSDELTLAIERCLTLSTEQFARRQSLDDVERKIPFSDSERNPGVRSRGARPHESRNRGRSGQESADSRIATEFKSWRRCKPTTLRC